MAAASTFPIYFFLTLLACISTSTSALPLPIESKQTLAKRDTSAQKVGTGIGITLALIFFALLAFALGMKRGRTGQLCCFRSASPPPPPSRLATPRLGTSGTTFQPEALKSRISVPVPIGSSAPVELSPVEARRKPKFLELPGDSKQIYEMGEPSPRRPSGWLDRGRRSWRQFTSAPVVEAEAEQLGDRKGKAMLDVDSDSEKGSEKGSFKDGSMHEMDADPSIPPAYPEAVLLRDGGEERLIEWELERERSKSKNRRSSGMDWAGLEYVRKAYENRKSAFKPGG